MSDNQIPDRDVKAFKRFVERLPHGKELDLVILKAHLLIEEQVNAIAKERLKNPSVLLSEDGFSSIYRIRLAQSFFAPDFQPWLWRALTKLNGLRNRIAHSIDPKGIQDIVDDLIQCIPHLNGGDTATRQERFEIALWSLFDAVSELVESRRASVVELVPTAKE